MSRIKDIVPAQLGFDALLSTGDIGSWTESPHPTRPQ